MTKKWLRIFSPGIPDPVPGQTMWSCGYGSTAVGPNSSLICDLKGKDRIWVWAKTTSPEGVTLPEGMGYEVAKGRVLVMQVYWYK